jgi:hypothetical protein
MIMIRESILSVDCSYVFHVFLAINSDYSLNRIDQMVYVIEKCCSFFGVSTEILSVT